VSQTYPAVIKQSGAWWIGWIEEREAREAAGDGFEEIPIAV
jgi:hypothetical protein